jgi:peptide deformylase
MYNASGVGLAAPQVGKALRVFCYRYNPLDDEDLEAVNKLKGFKRTFINAKNVG